MQIQKITHHIIDWLKKYLEDSKQKGFVIGISGGIDSAVVSTLCAMTEHPVLCMELPIYQQKDEINRAGNHIDWLKSKYKNVSAVEVDLSETFKVFETSVKKSENIEKTNLAFANSRSRLRMMTLYYYAGLHDFIVAGTGNKIEDFGVGFFTKYGDGGVDISPIGDLTKSEVYNIAEFLELNKDVQEAVPTDGLFADSFSDEEQLGATYPELEWAMDVFESGKKTDNFSERQKAVFEIFIKRNKANQHKVNPIPVCEIPKEWK